MAQATPRTSNWLWLLIAGISIAGCGADATDKSALIPAGAEGKQVGVVNYQVSGQSAEGFTVLGLGADGKDPAGERWLRGGATGPGSCSARKPPN